MWTVSARDLASLRGGGGQPFTRFVNALLGIQCFVYGIPDSAMATTLRVNVGDGGVDTRIDEFAAADTTGRLRCPSAWQFKAEDADRVNESSVAKEVQKHYATDLIQRGYGYRLCVCDEMPAERKGLLENALNAAARAINANARPCYILSASDLASWANRFPRAGRCPVRPAHNDGAPLAGRAGQRTVGHANIRSTSGLDGPVGRYPKPPSVSDHPV